jgi:hypothetical protein
LVSFPCAQTAQVTCIRVSQCPAGPFLVPGPSNQGKHGLCKAPRDPCMWPAHHLLCLASTPVLPSQLPVALTWFLGLHMMGSSTSCATCESWSSGCSPSSPMHSSCPMFSAVRAAPPSFRKYNVFLRSLPGGPLEATSSPLASSKNRIRRHSPLSRNSSTWPLQPPMAQVS